MTKSGFSSERISWVTQTSFGFWSVGIPSQEFGQNVLPFAAKRLA